MYWVFYTEASKQATGLEGFQGVALDLEIAKQAADWYIQACKISPVAASIIEVKGNKPISVYSWNPEKQTWERSKADVLCFADMRNIL